MFHKKNRAAIVCCILILAIGSFGVVPAKANTSANAPVFSNSNFLNLDGTLKLDGAISGSIDLQGWNVRIDNQSGPIFSSKERKLISPLTQANIGEWFALGSNPAGNDGALNPAVSAIAVSGTDVYVAGGFTNAGGIEAADYVAKWNGAKWSALGSNGLGNGSLNSVVEAIAVSGGNVYVGGDFTDVNNNGITLAAADYLAKWDGTNWSALGSNELGNGSLNYVVAAIAVSGSDIYVGGNFTDVNNNGVSLTAADYIAKFDGTNWSALGSNGMANGSLNAPVSGLAVSGPNLYAGGDFTNVNNRGTVLGAADYVGKWDGTNWSALGSNGFGDGSLNHGLYTVAVSNGNVYVGGLFYDVNNSGVPITQADYIAKFDGMNWSALGDSGNPGSIDGAIRGNVQAIAIHGTDVYVGGHFFLAGAVPGANEIARWNGTNWFALGNDEGTGGSINNDVLAIAVAGYNVYMGGFFSNVNNNGTILPTADFIAGYKYQPKNGADTTGVFRPSNGLLYLKNQNTTGFADMALNYGIPGDYPVVGDWDGNGDATIGVYRNGQFLLRNSNTVGFAENVFPFGQPGDQPIAGDWDGDGIGTIGVYRQSIGQFLLRNSNSAGAADASFYLGNVGDIGIAGDWNGDGIDTTGVFRPSNGVIFLKAKNETGYADVALNYGIPGDKPLTGDWDNDGIDTIGVYRNGLFYLRNENTNGFAEIVFGLGIPGDMPIAGNWDGLP